MNRKLPIHFNLLKAGEKCSQAGIRKALWLLPVLLLLGLGGAGTPSGTEPIELESEPLSFTPEEFYIAEVVDDRIDKNAVAWLLPIPSLTSQAPVAQPVDLKGGGVNAIRQFLKESLAADTSLRPVSIRLLECRVTETPAEKGSVEGDVSLSMAFEMKRGNDIIPLTEYHGSARYIRSSSKHTIVEKALRQLLSSSMNYLNNWMNQEAKHNIKLAQGIKISFTDYALNEQNDTVFYQTSRPLRWDDFLARPRNNRFSASVFPNFGYKNNSEVVDGYLNLNITMRVFMLKTESWVKESARDEYGLNHEQRHFDLVKIIAERFKNKIKTAELTLEDFDGELGYLYLESYREMNKLQEQYDQETGHGTNGAAQERWNKQIEEELRAFGVTGS